MASCCRAIPTLLYRFTACDIDFRNLCQNASSAIPELKVQAAKAPIPVGSG